ncbi:MAG: N-acetylmuramic acid 6-phosphate etherase [Hyphomicrobiales bacterium]
MQVRQTEQLHKAAIGIHVLHPAKVAACLIEGQADALSHVTSCADQIARGGELMASAIRAGACLHYAAAGSSALMALADACELAGTYGIDPAKVKIHMAGGIPQDASMPGDVEDDADGALSRAKNVAEGDVVITISASGSTPFALEFANTARENGASTICISNTPDSPLLRDATVAICLPTPPEVIAGSTRMGAGTAQKAALNTMSTVMGVSLGHVHDGMMVNLRADNDKLRRRATAMVVTIADVSIDDAEQFLQTSRGAVKPAIMLAAGAANLAEANDLIDQADGKLHAALATMTRRR